MAGDAKPMPLWYTIREAAEYLSVGEQTIYRWMREGKLTYRKIGDSTRFLRRDLDAMVQIFHGDDDTGNGGNVIQRCPACGDEDAVLGRLRGAGLQYFQPEKTKFWTLRQSMIDTSARMCVRCGYIASFGDVDHLHQLRQQASAGTVIEEPDPEDDPAEEASKD